MADGTFRFAAALFIAVSAGFAAPAGAQDLKALPGGGGLKDVPSFQNLPGVRMNVDPGSSGQADCTDERAPAFDSWGRVNTSGTIRRCKMGNFSVGTFMPGGTDGSQILGMRQFHGHYHPIQPEYRPSR